MGYTTTLIYLMILKFPIFRVVIFRSHPFSSGFTEEDFRRCRNKPNENGKNRSKKNCSGFAICGWLRGVGVVFFFFCPDEKNWRTVGFFGGQKKSTKRRCKVGPLPVITGFITPITRVIRTVKPFILPFIGVITPFITPPK